MSVVLVKDKLTNLIEIQTKLKQKYNEEYKLDDIEDCLIQIEEDTLKFKAQFKEQENIIEVPDDYYLTL